MTQNDVTTLVHAVGFVTGIALYAMLGVMDVRARGAPGGGGRAAARDRGADRIPLATAVLGLLWNAGALVLYGMRDLGSAEPLPWLGTVAFSALGFLPAVVVHSALQRSARRPRVAITGAAYALSGVAAALQAWSAVRDRVSPSRTALLLLTVGYALLLGLLALRSRRERESRGQLAVAALAAFAVMALHLSHHAAGGEPVASELLGHHASLPLALVILYQDYRFALADLFLKRALSAVLLVAVALAGYLAVAAVATPELARDPSDPRRTGAVLALIVAIALCYPLMRRLVHGFVDRVVLRRADYASLRASIVARIAPLESTTAVLDAVCEALAPAMSAGQVRWSEVPAAAGMAGSMTGDQTTHWTDARHLVAFVPVVTAEEPTYEITVAELRGGRRLLSDDLALLDAVAVAAARRIDAVRVAQERLEREAREHEVTRLAVEAELRALRAQLNPHFLFNALTTVGYLVQVAPDRALATLLRLTELLRAVLRPTAGELVSLAEELEIVTAYLAIEQARFEERLRVTVDVSDDARAVRVPALLVQPLVENAVKHGIAPQRAGGDVIVWARVEADGEGGSTPTLHLSVADSGVGVSPEELARRRAGGVGLLSVERRVAGVYDGAGRVSIRSAPGVGTSVELWLPVSCTPVAVPPNATSPLRKVG